MSTMTVRRGLAGSHVPDVVLTARLPCTHCFLPLEQVANRDERLRRLHEPAAISDVDVEWLEHRRAPALDGVATGAERLLLGAALVSDRFCPSKNIPAVLPRPCKFK